jgi:hypothetical protein
MLIAIVIGTLAAVASAVAAIVSVFNHRKIQEVHILVNNRLDAALEKIGNLEAQIRTGTTNEHSNDRGT